jgi:tetratricopeptide (TPR) repeat protein
MSSEHLTAELLDDLFDQRIAPRAFIRIGLQHLLELCPTCAEALRIWKERGRRLPALHGAPPGADYAAAFERLGALLRHEGPRIEGEQVRAEIWLAELLALPPEERLPAIERATDRLRGVAFAHRLLQASRAALPQRLEESFSLASAAQAVLHHADCGPRDVPLFGQALALMGNARRAQGELRTAERYLLGARLLTEHWAVSEPLACAEIDRLEGTLRTDQRRFSEAEALLQRSVTLYRSVDDPTQSARALIQLAVAHKEQGRPEEAAEVIYDALRGLDPEKDRHLYLCARYNLAYYLHLAGDHQQAWDHLIVDEDLYAQHAEPWRQLRLRWLEGKIAAALEHDETAELAFLEVREAFTAQGIGFDVACVSLDLALLYQRQGRTAELKAIAREIATLFEAQGVHRDALAAVILFRQAAEAETLSAGLIDKLSRYLEEAQRPAAQRSERAS